MEEFIASGMHWKLINFIAFVGILFFFLKKPSVEFWKTRSNEIKFQIEEAERLREEAEARNETLKKRVQNLEREIQELVHELVSEGELEKRKMIEGAEAQAQRIKTEMEKILAQELQKARETLKSEAAQFAFEMAEKMVRENINPEDQKRLTDRYVQDVRGME